MTPRERAVHIFAEIGIEDENGRRIAVPRLLELLHAKDPDGDAARRLVRHIEQGIEADRVDVAKELEAKKERAWLDFFFQTETEKPKDPPL